MPIGAEVALDEVIYFDVTTHVASTGAVSDADSTPTFAVYEEATDTDIGVGGNLTKRTSLTGNYRGTFTLSAANGFEVGKWYSIIASATVSTIAAKHAVGSFRVRAAEAIAGKPKVDVDALLGTAWLTPATAGTPDVNVKTITANAITAAAIAADAIGASEVAADVVTEIADAIIAELRMSGNAASAGATLASTDVDVFNQAMDLVKEAKITAFTDDRPVAAWGLRNYVTSRNAELREHPWKFAVKRRVLYPTDFVLDGITATLTGAWGTFRLTEKWSGDMVKLRRSSDSTTDTFGLATTTDDGETVFDDKILLDVDSIATFVGTGTGYFDTIYDQSGLGNDISQSTAAKQPLYTAELGPNDRVVAAFDGSNDVLSTAVNVTSLMSTTAGYMVIAGLIDAATLDSATQTSNHLLMGDAGGKLGLYVRKGGTLYGINNDGSLDAGTEGVAVYVPFVAELRHDSGVVYVRVNGEHEDNATSGATSSLANILNIGDLTAGSQALDFNMFAALTFSTVPTLAERDRIVARLMRFVATPGYKDTRWTYRYKKPVDCITVLQQTLDGEFEGRPIKHEVEGDYILTEQGPTLPCRYIAEFTDAGKFDPLFTEALAARIATKAAHWLSGKMGMVELVGKAYNNAIDKATKANAMEGTIERPADEDVLDQRYDAIGVR